MSYFTESIPSDELFCNFENVLLGFKFTRDKDLEENQIAIKIYNYVPGTKAPTKPKERPLVVEIKVDYAEILANYNHKKDAFNQDLIDQIFYSLNAELAPHRYQLKNEIKESISSVLKAYIPQKERPGKGID
jgi:hypothetical protein